MEKKSLITNQDIFLEEIINTTLPAAGNLFFLVGYFYFSGFEKLYRSWGLELGTVRANDSLF